MSKNIDSAFSISEMTKDYVIRYISEACVAFIAQGGIKKEEMPGVITAFVFCLHPLLHRVAKTMIINELSERGLL